MSEGAKVAKPVPPCRACGGTGWLWLDNSWIKSDGMRKCRCGICGGSGRSSYRGINPEFTAEQAKRRRARAGGIKVIAIEEGAHHD